MVNVKENQLYLALKLIVYHILIGVMGLGECIHRASENDQ